MGLGTETDLERLRQMALLLEAENARLHRRLGELTRALAQATGATHAQLELELQRLQDQLAARTRAARPGDAPPGRGRAYAARRRGPVSAVWRDPRVLGGAVRGGGRDRRH